MADTSISENLIKTMSRWLLASAALLLVLQLNQVGASAAAAAGLSEVWSETDGMRMKYSTNHGELLSSKGSEMSLSSDQKHHQLEPASESGGASDESAAVAEGGGGGSGHEAQGEESSEQQAKGEEGEGGSEQADSRKTEKVVPVNPTAGRVHSYSSLAGQTATGHAPASSRAQHAHHHHHQFKSSASSRSTSEAPSNGYGFSGSAPEDQMVNDNGEATATATATGGGSDEQSSVDAADEPLANEAPAGTSGGKFRTPGKHFKEAVKMVGSHKQETKAEAEADEQESSTGSKNDDDTKDEGEEKSGAPEEDTPSRPKSNSAAADETDENADFNASWGAASGKRARAQLDEETNGDFVGRPFEGSAAAAAGLDAESPISMAGSPLEQPEQHMFRPATARNQMMGVSAGHFNGNEDGESDAEQQMPLSNFRAASPSAGPMFYEGSAQSSRALPSAGNKERSQPSQSAAAAAAAAGKRQQQQSQQTGPATNKQAYKQLSYFKSVPDHPQRASQVPRYPTGAVRNNQPADNSPDSVRDNFISPGHYPGSMPHLTQAASEIAQSKSTAVVGTTRGSSSESATSGGGTLANAKEEQSKSSSQQVVTNAGSQSAPVSSDTNQQQQQQQGATTTAKQPAEEQQNQVAESKEVVSVVAVTPSPEAQQESQQIMAPILVTTTTMAPLLPTPASSSTTPAPSSTTTTSQTPALKRFKFRKYR